MAVNIRVNADTRNARGELKKLEGSVANIDKTTKRVSQSLTRLASGIATAFGTAIAVKSINNTTNSLIELENRIALVTGRTDQLAKSLDNVYTIARNARQPVELAAETFNRLGLALRGSGTSLQDIEKATLAIQRAVSISGGNIESARAAIFQLGQGLSAGALRGQELNSVLEQAPRIAIAIADNLGLTTGQLREIAAEGKITADVVLQALLNQSSKLEREFSDLNQTSTQAFQVMRDTIGRVAGEISRTIGFTQAFTDTFNRITDAVLKGGNAFEIGLYAGIADVVDILRDAEIVFNAVSKVAIAFTTRLGQAIGDLITPTRTLSDEIFAGFVGAYLKVSNAFARLSTNIRSLWDSLLFGVTGGLVSDLFDVKTVEEFSLKMEELAERIILYENRFVNLGNLTKNIFYSSVNSIQDALIYVGILNQSLFRFRTSSATTFEIVGEIILAVFKELYRNLKQLPIVTELLISFYVFSQTVKRVLEGLENDVARILGRVSTLFNKLFNDIISKSTQAMNFVKGIITNALIFIERMFFWVYDQVIGNSWWTDTMEETYGLAVKYLNKTVQVVNNFSNKVIDAYKNVYTKSKTYLSDLYNNEQIKITIKTEFEEFSKDPFKYFKESVLGIAESILKPIGKIIAEAYKEISQISPLLSGILVAAFGANLVALISTSISTGILKVVKGGLIATAFGFISSAFGDAILDSAVLQDFGKALGASAGALFEVIIANIPNIVRAFFQIARGFGQALADEISGIPGLLLKGITSIGLFDWIPGAIALALTAYFTGFGPTKIIDNFIKERQDKFDKGGNRISFLESVLIGKGGGRRTLAKYAGLIFAADQVLRSFIGDNMLTDVIIAGGIFSQILFGGKQASQLILQSQSIIRGIGQGLLGLLTTGNLSTFSQLFSDSADLIRDKYQGTMENISFAWLRFSRRFRRQTAANAAANALSLNVMSSAWESFMYRTGTRFAAFTTFIRRHMGKIAAGAAIAFALMPREAEAATSEVLDITDNMFGSIGAQISQFVATYGDVILFALLGTGAGAAIGVAVKKALQVAGAAIASFVGGLAIGNTARAGILSLAILGEGSFLAGLSVVLKGAGAAIASFITGTIGLVLAGATAAGLVGIALFGEGDTISERFGNAYDEAMKFFGGMSRAAKRLKKDLEGSLSGFDSVEGFADAGINVNFDKLLAGFNFENVNEKQTKELVKVANRTNRVLESAKRSIETSGELSASETRRVKRAVDLVKIEIGKANKGSPDAGSVVTGVSFAPISQAIANQSVSLGNYNSGDERGLLRQLDINNPSEALVDLITNLQTAFSKGSELDVASAILSIQDNAELQATESGKAFAIVIESLGASLSAEVEKGLSPEGKLRLNDLIADFAAALSVPLSRNLSGISDIQSGINKELDDARANYIIGLKTSAEELFKSAVKNLQAAAGEDAFDIDADEVAKRLSRRQLVALTEQLNNTAIAYTEGLERIDGNEAGDEYRKRFFARYDAALNATAEGIEKAAGLAEGKVEKALTPLEKINQQLSELDIEELIAPPTLFKNEDFLARAKQISVLQNEINDAEKELANNKNLTNKQVQEQVAKIANLKALLENTVQVENARTNALIRSTDTIENALSKVENSVSLDQVLGFEPSKITQILKASSAIDQLSLALARIALVGSGQVDTGIIEALKRARAKAQEQLDSILGGGDSSTKSGGGSGESPWEKFVSSLGGIGFEFGLENTLNLSGKAMKELIGYTKQYEAAQKKVNKLAVDDITNRQKLAKELDTIQAKVANILGNSTFANLDSVLSGLGSPVDVSDILSKPSANVREILKNTLRLRDIEQEIGQLTVDQIDKARELFAEAEKIKASLEGNTVGADFAESFKGDFENGLAEALKTGDFKEFGKMLLDSFTNSVIDAFAKGITEGLFGENGLLGSLFQNIFDWSKGVGKTVTGAAEAGTQQGAAIGDLFKNIGNFFKTIFKGLFSFIGGIFGGGGGAALYQGGVVPNKSFQYLNSGGIVNPQIGKDSVPVMLTPGEYVLPSKRAAELLKGENKSTQQTVVNLNVTGDISRQTKKEVMKMIPQIAAGVGTVNRERG
jgi:tape measure domain-containing protein